MAKIKLNPIIEEVRGQLGELVFRKSNGKITLSRKPAASSIEPSEAQVAQRDRFRLAVAYGKFAIADTATRAVYENAAEQKGTSTFALTVADFLNLPSVDQVDISAYHGQIGNNIPIITSDDFGVVNVHVTILNAQGTIIESGNAIEYPVGTGHWNYTATVSVPAGTTLSVKVTATDRPGGTAISNHTKII